MREILFKAKDLNGKWVEGSLKDVGGIQSIITFDAKQYAKEGVGGWDICDFTDEVSIDKNTVCQFTGLTDKNGVKIFEGDKLHIEYNHLGTRVVEFNKGAFNCNTLDLKRCIVIGNIHD